MESRPISLFQPHNFRALSAAWKERGALIFLMEIGGNGLKYTQCRTDRRVAIVHTVGEPQPISLTHARSRILRNQDYEIGSYSLITGVSTMLRYSTLV